MRHSKTSLHSFSVAVLAALSLAGLADAQSQSATFVNTVDGYVEAAYSPDVVPRSGLTIEAWVTYDETTIGPSWRYPTIVRQNGDAGQESFFLRVESNDSQQTAIRFLVNTTNGVSNVNWNFGPQGLINWTHLAATYDGAVMKLYADGLLVGSTPASGALVDNGGFFRIGKGSDVATPIEVFNGSIDEVRLWPFARTIEEINATMDVELSSMPGRVSTWNLDGSGFDSSGTNPATVSGSVAFTPPAPGLLVNQPFPGAGFGTSTPGCAGPLAATAGSLPTLGNPIFSLVAHTAAAGQPAFGYIGLSSLGTPLSVLGMDVWVDPLTAIGLFPATTVGPLGAARLNFPVPATLPPGFQATVQFLSFDSCGPQGFSASNGLGLLLIP